MKKLFCIFGLLLLAAKSPATLWYVDSAASGTHNGTSWANAWTSLSQISGVSAGDTVYISGGPTVGSETYSVSSWKPAGGSAGLPITYRVGQDAAHNGTVIFSGTGTWFGGANNAVISGDAGDGAMHFVCIGYTKAASINSDSNLRISHVNLGSALSAGIEGQGISSFMLDHCYAYISDINADHFVSCGVNGTTWDNGAIIATNVIYCPHLSSNANGADFFQFDGTGFSLYGNLLIGYSTNYTGGQHQDGWQGVGPDTYIQFAGNVFLNIQNFGLFGDAYYGGFSHVRACNNIFLNCTGTCFGTDGGYNGPSPCTFNDVVIANNLMDYTDPTSAPWALNNVTAFATSFTSCVVADNTVINGQNISLQGDTTSTVLNNVVLTRTQAASDFVSYSAGTTNSNFHLLAAATGLIGKGTNLSSYFTTDKDGNVRVTAGNWDIGPYAYSTNNGVVSNTPTIQVSPGNLGYGTVLLGTSVTNSIMVKNTGTGTLNGSATASAPFNVVSGSSYSLGAGQTQSVVVVFSPVVATNYSQSVNFTGGGGTNVSVSGIVTNTNSVAPALGTIVNEKVTANITNQITLQICTNLSSSVWWTLGNFAGSTNLSFTNMPAVFIRGVCNNLTGSITLTWPASTSPSTAGYKVYYGTSSGVYSSVVNVGKATTLTVSGLAEGQIYFFLVDTYNSLGTIIPYLSESSSTVPLTTYSLSIGH